MDGSAAPHPPTPQEAAQELVRRKRIRVSFYDFVKEAWSQFEFGRPFTEGWAIGAVAEHCQAVISGEIDDLLINIPPRMSKPVADDSLVLRSDGKRVRLRDVLVGDQILTHMGRFRRVAGVHHQGILDTLTVSTAAGRHLTLAFDHPILTTHGWKQAGLLTTVDVLAAVPCGASIDGQMSAFEARLLGYIVGDGCVTGSVNITCADPAQTADIMTCARAIGFDPVSYEYGLKKRKPHHSQTLRRVSIRGGTRVREWLRSHALYGKNSYQKRVPEAVMSGGDQAVAEFIGAYLSCDGCVTMKGRDRADVAILFDSVNREMLSDVQHLLLRLGINAKIRKKVAKIKTKAQGDSYVSYCMEVSGHDNVHRFAARIPIYGEKATKINATFIPKHEFDPSLFGDQVVEISRGGRHECMCLTVEEDHSFTANDLAVHNSTMVSVCLTPWAWIDTPTLQVLSASYSDVIATNDHVKCRRLVESAWYQTRFPHITLADDQNTKGKFDNTLGGYRVRTSTDGSTTGQGGDLILIDDPNNANDTSDAALNATLNWWRDVLPTRVNNPLKQKRIVVQQRVHEKDISGEIMREGGPSWVKLILPMEFEERRRCTTVKLPSTGDNPWTDPRVREGELLWPERVDKTALDKIKRPMSTYARAGQLQQRPSPGEGGIIKRKWFKTWKQARPPSVDFTILSVDTAMSEQKEAAYNAATTWGVFKAPETGTPSVILLSVWREKCEYPELRKRIQRLSRNYLDEGPLEGPPAQDGKNYRPTMVLIERKNNGISLIQELSRSEITVHGFNPDKLGDKTMRVRLVTPLLESGRVWMPGAPLSNYERLRPYADEFVEQCASFPKAESRDLVDTMTQALWRLHQSGWIWVGGDPEPTPEYTNPGGDGDGEPIYG